MPPERLSIVQAGKFYHPCLGGVETVVRALAEGFAARGCLSQVVAAGEGWRTRREELAGVRLIRAGTAGRALSLPLSPAYPCHLARLRGDILQLHEPCFLGALAVRAAPGRARGHFRRLVLWWHHEIVRQRALAFGYLPLLRWVARRADAIVVATPHHLTSSAWLGPFAGKARVIPYGIDPARFEPTPAVAERAAAWRARFPRPIVLFSGRLVYYKGADRLVEAMGQVPEAQLVVVGEGPLGEPLRRQAAAAGNGAAFLPFLEEPDYVALYHACEVFALPSVAETEAFGLVQVEAMACGKPVVTTDLPTGVTWVNQADVTGLVVPRGDPAALAGAIRRLLADAELRARLGTHARERVRRELTVDRMVDRTLALYRELLGQRGPGEAACPTPVM